MNTLLKEIIMILSGIVGGYILILIKNKVFSKAKEQIIKVIPEEEKIKMKELMDKGFIPKKLYEKICIVPEPTEEFNKEKLITGLTKINNKTLWAKDIHDIFNLRKLIIIGVIIGVIFGYGYYKGRKNAPVHFDMRGKEATIKLNEHSLKIEKNGTAKVIDKDGKILKTIRVEDIPELERAIRPFGFELKPFVSLGGGIGAYGFKKEIGAGLEWFKYFKYNLNSYITNAGAYPLGIGYNITQNFDLLLGVGQGWNGDTRINLSGKWRF